MSLNFKLDFNLNDKLWSVSHDNFLLKQIRRNLLPQYLNILDAKTRFNEIKGGRGSAKSTSIADILIIESFDTSLKNSIFLCCREYQSSISFSVFRLIATRIYKNKLDSFFIISKDKIINKVTGIIFIFKGLKNPSSIKSISDITRVWVEEAESLSLEILELVIPSVRGVYESEVKFYFTYNPFKVVDNVSIYCSRHSSKSSLHINIYDLPGKYQNKILLEEASRDKIYNTDLFQWKWLGQPYPGRSNEPFVNLIISKKNISIFKNMESDIYGFIDPSFKGRDFTALSIACLAESGSKIIVWGKLFSRSWNECSHEIIDAAKQLNVDNLFYEDNGLGTVLRDVFYDYGAIASGITSKGNKVDRIYRVAAFMKYIEFIEDEESYSYINQIKFYNSNKSTSNKLGEHDDAPDSLSNCLIQMGIIN